MVSVTFSDLIIVRHFFLNPIFCGWNCWICIALVSVTFSDLIIVPRHFLKIQLSVDGIVVFVLHCAGIELFLPSICVCCYCTSQCIFFSSADNLCIRYVPQYACLYVVVLSSHKMYCFEYLLISKETKSLWQVPFTRDFLLIVKTFIYTALWLMY